MSIVTTKTERSSLNFGANLSLAARKYSDALAVAEVVGRKKGKAVYREINFRNLEEYSNRIAKSLIREGIREGMHTVLMVTPGRDFSALVFALLKLKAIPILVDPGLSLKNLKTCFTEVKPEAFIGVPQAHLARKILGWGKESLSIFISVGPRKFGGLFRGGLVLDKLLEKVSSADVEVRFPELHEEEGDLPMVPTEQTACIAFTSGSTGVPKGVVFTHGMMNAEIKAIESIHDMTDIKADLTTFPLFSIFLPALGVASIFPEMDASRPSKSNPAYLCEAVKDYACGSIFASPAVVELLGSYCMKSNLKLESLKAIFSAGAPARNESLERFRYVLSDDGKIYTPYGATEALPVSCIESESILNETRYETEKGGGVCVGKPVAGLEIFVIGITDEEIPFWSSALELKENQVGEIVVRGPNVTEEYYNRPTQTALAKIKDPDTGAIYHRMGDVGRLDEQGRLWMMGRKTHRVSLEDGDLFTVSCEGIFNTHPDVFRTALVGVPNEMGELTPVICVELNRKPLKKVRPVVLERIRHEILEIGGDSAVTKAIKNIMFFDEFPVDIRHNAKIFREILVERVVKSLKKNKRRLN